MTIGSGEHVPGQLVTRPSLGETFSATKLERCFHENRGNNACHMQQGGCLLAASDMAYKSDLFG